MYNTFQMEWVIIISSEQRGTIFITNLKLGEHQAVFGATSNIYHRAKK